MKEYKCYALILLINCSLISNHVMAVSPTIKEVKVEPGYPFGLLANMADKIEIKHELMSDNKILCSTVTFFKEQTWSSESVYAAGKDFNEDPLRACLTRQGAKDILKNVFEQ